MWMQVIGAVVSPVFSTERLIRSPNAHAVVGASIPALGTLYGYKRYGVLGGLAGYVLGGFVAPRLSQVIGLERGYSGYQSIFRLRSF